MCFLLWTLSHSIVLYIHFCTIITLCYFDFTMWHEIRYCHKPSTDLLVQDSVAFFGLCVHMHFRGFFPISLKNFIIILMEIALVIQPFHKHQLCWLSLADSSPFWCLLQFIYLKNLVSFEVFPFWARFIPTFSTFSAYSLLVYRNMFLTMIL